MEFALHDEDALAWLVGCFWVKVFCFFFFSLTFHFVELHMNKLPMEMVRFWAFILVY